MKKGLIISAIVVCIVLLLVFLVVPIFAQSSGGPAPTVTPSATPSTTTAVACPNMQQVSQNGSYQSTMETCQEISSGTSMPDLEQAGNTTCPHQNLSGQTNANDMMSFEIMNSGMMNSGMMGSNTATTK